MTLEDIKETKRYGRSDGRMHARTTWKQYTHHKVFGGYNHKKITHKPKFRGLVFFQVGYTGLKSPVLQFEKNCSQNTYLPQKLYFCIFEPKNCEVIENSSKAPLNLVPWNAHIWAKIHLNIISAKSEKMKLKSGHLELHFSVDHAVPGAIDSGSTCLPFNHYILQTFFWFGLLFYVPVNSYGHFETVS